MPVVMDGERMGRTLTRIAHEIVERNRGVGDLALVGVRTRGVPIAQAARRQPARDHRRRTSPRGALDITLYRDDLMRHAVGPQPIVRARTSRSRSTAATSSSSTTCSTPGGRSAPRSTR